MKILDFLACSSATAATARRRYSNLSRIWNPLETRRNHVASMSLLRRSKDSRVRRDMLISDLRSLRQNRPFALDQ
jgi:hypothetical protein